MNLISREGFLNRWPLHAGKRFPHHETELPHTAANDCGTPPAPVGFPQISVPSVGHDGLHQLAASVRFCTVGSIVIAQRQQSWLLIQTVATDDFSIPFSHHIKKPRVREHHRKDANGNLGVGGIWRKIVVIGRVMKASKQIFADLASAGTARRITSNCSLGPAACDCPAMVIATFPFGKPMVAQIVASVRGLHRRT